MRASWLDTFLMREIKGSRITDGVTALAPDSLVSDLAAVLAAGGHMVLRCKLRGLIRHALARG